MRREILIFSVILVIFMLGCIAQPSIDTIDNAQTNNQSSASAKNLTDQNATATENATNLTGQNATVPKKTVPYKNDLYTLDTPENWEIEENDAFTYFKSPAHEGQNELQENVVVYTKQIEAADQDLKDFFQNSIEILMSTSPGFTIINHSEYNLGDVPAYKILYSEGEEGSEIDYLQVFAVKDNDGYIITYTAPAETFDKYLPEAEAIMRSYRLT